MGHPLVFVLQHAPTAVRANLTVPESYPGSAPAANGGALRPRMARLAHLPLSMPPSARSVRLVGVQRSVGFGAAFCVLKSRSMRLALKRALAFKEDWQAVTRGVFFALRAHLTSSTSLTVS